MRRLFVSWFYRVVFLAIWIFQILERFWECTFRVEPRYLYRLAVSGRPLKFSNRVTRTWRHVMHMWRSSCAASDWAGDVEPVEPMWKPNLGRSETAPTWSQVVPRLRPSGSKLGLVGESWPQVEPMLRTCGVQTVNLDDVAARCEMCKLPQQGNQHPPQPKLYHWTEDCSN